MKKYEQNTYEPVGKPRKKRRGFPTGSTDILFFNVKWVDYDSMVQLICFPETPSRFTSLVVILFKLSGFSIMFLLFLTTLFFSQERHTERVNTANTSRGRITGKYVSHDGSPFKVNPLENPKEVQLYDALIRKKETFFIKNDGAFSFENLGAGEYIVNIESTEDYDHTVVVLLGENESKDIGEQRLIPYPRFPSFFVDINDYLPKLYPIDIDSQYPVIYGHKILTVCEYLKMRADYPIVYPYSNRVIIIGNLVQTPQGNWLQQSCGTPVKSGVHNWPDAIFLGNNVDDMREVIIEKNNNNALKEADKRFGKDFILSNSNNDNSVAVAVIGRLTTRENLVHVSCGEGKTCGFGYGPIAAPAQIEYWQMHHLNQDDINTQ